MSESSRFLDYPIGECGAQADKLIAKGCEVHQKWTCGKCGSRQTMEMANTFYTSGVCEACGNTTDIEECNYMLIIGGAK